ncbi:MULTISPECIES: hypothetical protein [unclassified Duganella]|uniref:hypothetical protein n=1 Tax=unclassified Duganella TaxID=2636909 RepID=UPI0013142CAE|nr:MULTISPECIES: hypothetical protein [unclassified Duganella]
MRLSIASQTRLKPFFAFVAAAAMLAPAYGGEVARARLDVLQWPRMSVRDFGCMLEQSLGHREPKFNCSLKKFKPVDNPCVSAYYDGFEFPPALVSKVHPLLSNIELAWEHGQLQSVSLDFKGKIDANALRKAFGLDKTPAYPENIMSVDIQDCSRDSVCLLIQGFDHMGAGDVDCGK